MEHDIINIEKYTSYNPLTFENSDIVRHDQSFYGSMVYFLFVNIRGKRCLLYIGQTTRGFERTIEHEERRHIPFSDWDYIPVPFRLLDAVEKYYIKEYRPILNFFDNPLYMRDESHYIMSVRQFHHAFEFLIKRINDVRYN